MVTTLWWLTWAKTCSWWCLSHNTVW